MASIMDVRTASVDLDRILEVFGDAYDLFFDAQKFHQRNPDGYNKYYEFGMHIIADYRDLTTSLEAKRQDLFFSDREIAALGFACYAVLGRV